MPSSEDGHREGASGRVPKRKIRADPVALVRSRHAVPAPFSVTRLPLMETVRSPKWYAGWPTVMRPHRRWARGWCSCPVLRRVTSGMASRSPESRVPSFRPPATTPAVLSRTTTVPKRADLPKCARQDSNLRPADSKRVHLGRSRAIMASHVRTSELHRYEFERHEGSPQILSW